MNRFTQQKPISKSVLSILVPVVVFFAVFFLFLPPISSISATTKQEEVENLKQAVIRSTIYCYAVEGAYPSKSELYRIAVSNTYELEIAQRVLFKNKVKGRFTPLRYIASGSFSKVFLCEDAEGQVCVLKLSLIGTELDYKACICQ